MQLTAFKPGNGGLLLRCFSEFTHHQSGIPEKGRLLLSCLMAASPEAAITVITDIETLGFQKPN